MLTWMGVRGDATRRRAEKPRKKAGGEDFCREWGFSWVFVLARGPLFTFTGSLVATADTWDLSPQARGCEPVSPCIGPSS